jgi:hypothetical protein
MNLDRWLKSGIGYGLDLIRSAVEGARSAGEQIHEQESPRSALIRSARTSLAPSLAAASLGLVAGYWVSRGKSAHKTVVFGLAGAVLGFAGGMAWSTRRMTGGMARGAIKKMDATRDAHWLSKHPIDYA